MEKMILVDTNHNKVVYIYKREHDDPHGLPQQQYLEDSTETEHTLYSHTSISSPKIDSFKKIEYIYQHFQDSKRSMNQILMQLGMRPITSYTHILTMISNTVYLKMLSIATTNTMHTCL